MRLWPTTAATSGRACKEREQTKNEKGTKESNSRSETEPETKNKTKIKEKLLKM